MGSTSPNVPERIIEGMQAYENSQIIEDRTDSIKSIAECPVTTDSIRNWIWTKELASRHMSRKGLALSWTPLTRSS